MVEAKDRGNPGAIESAIKLALKLAPVDSEQEIQARMMKDYFEELVSLGFKDTSLAEGSTEKLIQGDHIMVIHPSFKYDSRLRKVDVDGRVNVLNQTEDRLFRFFLEHPNKRYYPKKLQKIILGEGYHNHYISQLIRFLRLKVEKDVANPAVIISYEQSGYSLEDNGEMVITRNADGSIIPRPEPQDSELPFFHEGFKYFPQRGKVEVGGQEVELSERQHLFLGLLTSKPDEIIPHTEFVKVLPGIEIDYDFKKNKGLVKKVIQSLRCILEPDESNGQYKYIVSERGFGYGLVCDPNKLGSNTKLKIQGEDIYTASQNILQLV